MGNDNFYYLCEMESLLCMHMYYCTGSVFCLGLPVFVTNDRFGMLGGILLSMMARIRILGCFLSKHAIERKNSIV